jgi:hypothetical protein
VDVVPAQVAELADPAPDVLSPRTNFRLWVTGLKMRKKGAVSIPVPATHCQLRALLARSASTSPSEAFRY